MKKLLALTAFLTLGTGISSAAICANGTFASLGSSCTLTYTNFTLTLPGEPRPSSPLQPNAALLHKRDGLAISLAATQPLRANTDLEFALSIRDQQTQQPVADLEPFLGAWAHFVIIDD